MKNFGSASGRKFRLSICLKRFYSDERRRCYVSVWSGLRVRWLAKRLRRLFSMTGPFCLLSAGHLLPPDESLELLEPDDVVEAIPKHYNIFDETSDTESEILSLFGNESYHSTENDNQKNTNVVNNQHKDEMKQNPPVLEKCNFLSSSREEVKEIGMSREHEESDKVGEDKIDAVVINTTEQGGEEIENKQYDEMENILLDEVKLKALQFLDKCSTTQKRRIEEVGNEVVENINTTEGSDLTESQCDKPDKKKRKRVRRRRPRAATDAALSGAAPDDEPQEASPSETLILRNNAEQNRTARLVYSLS